MKQVLLKDLKPKSLFRLVKNETAPLWVKDTYDRFEKRYVCYQYEDVNKSHMFRGNRGVFLEDYE